MPKMYFTGFTYLPVVYAGHLLKRKKESKNLEK